MKTAQLKSISLLAVAVLCISVSALAGEHDYYGTLHYPKELVPGVGLDTVEQEGGPDATGYQRRTVQWWPRQGQDIVDVPEGAAVADLDAKQRTDGQGGPGGRRSQLDPLGWRNVQGTPDRLSGLRDRDPLAPRIIYL